MTRIHRLGVVLAAATLTLAGGAVAEAKPGDVKPPAHVAALCTKYGGTASSGPGAWWCNLPDGRTLWCFPDGWCTWTRTGGESSPVQPPTEGVYDDPATSPTPTLAPTSGVG